MLDPIQTRLLVELYKSKSGLLAFTLFRRAHVTMRDFAKSLDKLKGENLIEEKDNFICITSDGKKIATKLLPLQGADNKPWRSIPSHFLGPQLRKGDFYIPSKKKLDGEITT